jgi:hypothetical protein
MCDTGGSASGRSATYPARWCRRSRRRTAEHAVGRTEAGVDAWQGAVEILELLGHPEADRTRAKLRTAAHR